MDFSNEKLENQVNNRSFNDTENDQQKKKRRKRVDQDGRDYTCVCGKSYLSYPALYTHVKTKHNGELLKPQSLHQSKQFAYQQNYLKINEQKITQVQKNKSSNLMNQKNVNDLQMFIQFLDKQFIRSKSKQSIENMKSTLKLKTQDQQYLFKIKKVYQIEFKQEYQKNVKISQNYTQNNENYQDKIQDIYDEENKNQNDFYAGLSNDIIRRIATSQRSVLSMGEKPRKLQSQLSENQKQSEESSNDQNKLKSHSIDYVFGKFLDEKFIKQNSSINEQLINSILSYFVCQFKRYFCKMYGDNYTSNNYSKKLIDNSNQFATYLISSQNPYIRQPVVVCKLIFYFIRWMFKAKLTNYFVKWNKAGNN